MAFCLEANLEVQVSEHSLHSVSASGNDQQTQAFDGSSLQRHKAA